MQNRGSQSAIEEPLVIICVLVKTKDGNMRFRMEYREANVRKNDISRLPRIDDTLDSLNHTK